MAQTIEGVMTRDPVTMRMDQPMQDAARAMRENDIGTVVVVEDGQICDPESALADISKAPGNT